MQSEQRLRITEIFYSLQGESLTSGLPTVFIRLTGCPLRCNYCDTEYAFTGGNWMSFDEVMAEIATYSTTLITVTGGEPLAQKQCTDFLKRLSDEGYLVSLETSGAMDVSGVDERVVKVMDIKTPGSGEVTKNRRENIEYLSKQDQVKFVISDRADYEWSVEYIRAHSLEEKCHILFSPVFNRLEPGRLADWMLQDRLPVRMQIQLHKVLWGDVAGK